MTCECCGQPDGRCAHCGAAHSPCNEPGRCEACYDPDDAHGAEAEDAVGVLLHFLEHPGQPCQIPCLSCSWQDGDGQFSRVEVDGLRTVCPHCHGAGWVTIRSAAESPWVIDSLTLACAKLHLMWG